MRRHASIACRVAAVALATLGAGDARADSSAPLVEQELMKVDRAFAAATLEKGLEGWLSFFAPDGIRLDLHGPIVQGVDKIREFDGGLFANPDRRLVWEPTDARAFSGSAIGMTRGTYALEGRNADGEWEPLATGRYLTWWRRGGLGWRVVLDTGAPDPPPRPEAPEGDGPAEESAARAAEAGDGGRG